MLNRLVDILLKIYLAPAREQRDKAYIIKKKIDLEKKKEMDISKHKKKTSNNYISIINKSRNGKRQLFKNERK